MAVTGPMQYYTVEDLEESMGRVKVAHFIRDSEAGLLKRISDIAYETAWDPDVRAIFVSGPTSSGKTTFTGRLAAAYHMHGRPTAIVSLDDYYRDGYTPRIVDLRPDLESLYTLDVELFLEHFSQIIEGQEVWIPTFNFKTTRREYHEDHKLRLPPGGILLIEGLHGLNADISGKLNPHEYRGILLMPWATLASDRTILGPRDIRIYRRMSRDVMHRGTSPLSTLDYWPMLDLTEGVTFPDYLARADYFVNSALPYEFLIIPQLACLHLSEDLRRMESGTYMPAAKANRNQSLVDPERAVHEAKRLLAAAETLPSISPSNVPENSILNEFIR